MPELSVTIVVVSLLVILGFLLHRESSRADATRRNRFRTRPTISDAEFIAGCGLTNTEGAQVAITIRRRIAEVLGVPAEQVAPDDKFDGLLAPVHGWEFDDETNILRNELSAELVLRQRRVNVGSIRTVKDYVVAWIDGFSPSESS